MSSCGGLLYIFNHGALVTTTALSACQLESLQVAAILQQKMVPDTQATKWMNELNQTPVP